jgi:hypothetical protein
VQGENKRTSLRCAFVFSLHTLHTGTDQVLVSMAILHNKPRNNALTPT